MRQKLAGVIKSSEFEEEIVKGFGRSGIVLRPDGHWIASIIIHRNVTLLFPNGHTYIRRVVAGETDTTIPAIVVEPIPETSNNVPEGTEVFVDYD